MLIQLVEIDEQILQAFFGDSLTVILDFDFHWNEIALVDLRAKLLLGTESPQIFMLGRVWIM